MAAIDTLLVDTLSLRGLGNQFNSFERLFQSKSDALQAVDTGDYVPTAGKLNTVLIAGEENAIQFWSFDIQDFVPISDFGAAGNQSNKYIDLDGVNDYIGFDNADSVLDFTQDWTIGVTLVGVTGASSPQNMTLFSRGGVHITLKAQQGSTNWGLYWKTDNENELQFHGNGIEVANIDLDNGNAFFGGNVLADNATFTAAPAAGGNNVKVGMGTSTSFKIQTNHGYVEVGPHNGSWSHFYTDTNGYYFDEKVVTNGNLFASYGNNDLFLRRDSTDTTYNEIVVKNNETFFRQFIIIL